MPFAILEHVSRSPWRYLTAVAVLNIRASSPAKAEITELRGDKRGPAEDPGNSGRSGDYELIRGRLFGEVDPHAPANRIIQDIALAPRNARGKVEYVATFVLLRPVNAANDAGVLISAVPNRGSRRVASWGFLPGLVDPMFYDRGWSTLWVGWQGDLSERPSREASAAGLRMESLLVPRATQAVASRSWAPT